MDLGAKRWTKRDFSVRSLCSLGRNDIEFFIRLALNFCNYKYYEICNKTALRRHAFPRLTDAEERNFRSERFEGRGICRVRQKSEYNRQRQNGQRSARGGAGVPLFGGYFGARGKDCRCAQLPFTP